MRNLIPRKWIEDYIKRIKDIEVNYQNNDGYFYGDLDDVVKQEMETMLNEYDIEEQIAEKNREDYVLCQRRVEVIGRMPNGYTITKEFYEPVGEEE